MSNGMSKEAIAARRAYMAAYREKNRAKINAYSSKWQKENPDKVKEYKRKHWQRIADNQTDT